MDLTENTATLTAIGAVRVGDLITEADTPAGPYYRVVRNVPGLLTIATDEADPIEVDLPTTLRSAVLVIAEPVDEHPTRAAADAALVLF